jgi:hypothetical protein
VEFAIGTVVILLVMLASAEIGRLYYSYNTLTKAVRTGSRYLSTVALNSASLVDLSEDKIARTRNLVVNGNPGGSGESLLEGLVLEDINISQYHLNETISQYVQVSAVFNYQPMLGVISGFGFGEAHDFGFTMNVTSTMRVLK